MARRYKTSREKRIAQKKYRRSKKQYRDYLKQFEARKTLFAERGLDFYDPNALTYRDWKTVRLEKINDLKLDIQEGKRKSIGNVNREIVSDQAYELSSKQAEAIADYLFANERELLESENILYKYTDESGNEVVNLKKRIEFMMKIRQGQFLEEDVGWWDMIRDFRSKMFEQGKTAEEVRKEVKMTFYNSPE